MFVKKAASLFLIALVLNLNMLVPAVSYAAAEETCRCHLESADRQCHCDEGCNSCGMHKEQGADVRSQKEARNPSSVIKGISCHTSPSRHDETLPILGMTFLPTDFSYIMITDNPSKLNIPNSNRVGGVTPLPSERPPAV